MADYIYLLENRLSAAQQRAIRIVRDLARTEEMTVFLTGGAVRDLTAGSAVRDLDLTVVGDATKLRAGVEASGAIFTGDNARAQVLYFLFPGGVRVEVSTAVSIEFPKPGKPVYTPTGIIEDLRRRDFTANAMALSLNEGSYGLLMDPLNGVADIENRELRLISNYGFLEDPIRMVRGIRLSARLGWQMEERTRQRYESAKAEDLFGSVAPESIGYELEEIFYEEDPVRVMRALDAEGWLKLLSPQLASAKPNEAALTDLREKQGQLLTQGVLADASALALPLLLGKLSAADQAAVKKSFARPGFATQVDTLESRTRDLQTRFSGKEAATPSAAWRMLHEAEPELVLSMLLNGKGVVQQRLKTFLNDSPTARQRIPYATLQEMRITPDLPEYKELLDKLFFELMDGKLSTPEELKAYLEPYSPPAPPPPVNLRRARAKKEARPSRAKGKKAAAAEAEATLETVAEQEEALGVAEGLMEPGTLTGPDRGPEPTPETPLEGKVAPLAPREEEPTAQKPAKPAKAPKVLPEADTEAARKLTAQPAPVATRQGKAATTPHPEASRDVAAKRPVVIPQASAKQAAPKQADRGNSAKAVAPSRNAAKVAPPAKKSSPAKSVPQPKKGSGGSAKPSSKAAVSSAKGTKAPAKAAKAVKTAPPKKGAAAPSASSKQKPAVKAVKAKSIKPNSATPAKKAPAKAPVKSVPARPAKKAASKAAKSAPKKSGRR
ncbi:CCA tRNA nucleotidyltransferase [Terriglobus aquaticus]|uniref:CCA tRNA nucleotidyltransferase n=1 Tax=Terriglobus aquaticus TaxID=940139 RepID=A0ABW9KJX8_9BACT|nr:CCA tRNA nucleotidyltransferase [Terriglobus aquaticus]